MSFSGFWRLGDLVAFLFVIFQEILYMKIRHLFILIT